MKEEVERWKKQATRDLNTAKYLFEGKKYAESALFCQQSIEKALKALILKNKRKIIKSHDLVFLAETAGLPENLKNNYKELTLIYTYVRYPDVSPVTNIKSKAERYLEIAKEALRWIKKQL